MNATEACIALNMLPTVGPVRLRKLLEVFKQPQQILAAKRNELRKVEGIGSEVADQINNWESIVDLGAELDRIREFGPQSSPRNRRHTPSRSERFMRRRLCFMFGVNCKSGTIMQSASSARGALLTTEWNPQKSSRINSPMQD
jgi:NAD-dependent DNA ligase